MPGKDEKDDGDAGAGSSAVAKGGVKRRRAAFVSTASTLHARALFASTRDELLDIQGELEALAEERCALIAADAASNSSAAARTTSTSKAVLHLLPPSIKKT